MDDKKVNEQKELLIKLRKDFEDEAKPDGQTWTEEEIMQLLRSLPLAIFKQGNNVVVTMTAMKTAKQNLKRVYSQKLLEANYDSELKAANERKAFAENSEEYTEAETELILAEGNYRAAELHYSAYENLYTAVKKASSIVQGQNLGQVRINN